MNYKKLVVIIAIMFVVGLGQSFCDVSVNGHFRSNGTYVQTHYRSNPDGNPYNNYSFPGNTNPYTGETATGNSDTYLKNYYRNSYDSSDWNW